ncbi:hypothetical protein [Sulfitobacter sp. S190]|uniref:hypothetical protein n=1 Tax=Sulfitobacter sp. S190 TaxID=2867022 RepID=UPI0021A77B9D|nr:hypothetical protein [Sulfitobacter sp. S190]UWR21481.1 hypothetical protein K3756_12315 [Sulfitobacter sp. S190]
MLRFLTPKPRPTVATLQALVRASWAKTGLPPAAPIATRPYGDGSVHVEVGDDGFDLVVEERGVELERQSGLSLQDAAARFLMSYATAHGQARELTERRPPQGQKAAADGLCESGYARWNWMAIAILTARQISPALGARLYAQFHETLEHHPPSAQEQAALRWTIAPIPRRIGDDHADVDPLAPPDPL